MGNYKFRLCNILPNVWFYKLRDMGTKSKKKQPTSTIEQQQKICSKTNQPHHSYTRKSYYFTRELAKGNERNCNSSKTDIEDTESHSPKDTPTKSSKHKAAKRRAILFKSSPSNKFVNSSVSTGCRCRKKSEDQLLDITTHSPDRSDNALPTESFEKMLSLSSSCVCRVDNFSDKDIIINIDKNSLSNKINKDYRSDMLSGPELPPIITNSVKCKDVKKNHAMNNTAKGEKNTHVKRFSGNPPGVRLRVNSPRIAGRKIQHARSRKSIYSSSSSSRISLRSSYAVVKSSCDPQGDFKQSMMAMIVENNMKSSKDLEDLLACYLSLNSDEYHDLIVRVFKEIWCDLFDTN